MNETTRALANEILCQAALIKAVQDDRYSSELTTIIFAVAATVPYTDDQDRYVKAVLAASVVEAEVQIAAYRASASANNKNKAAQIEEMRQLILMLKRHDIMH